MARSKSNDKNPKQTILDVSTKLFAKHGFEGVTMRQIATESKLSMPSIYHHFVNKEDLFKAVETEMYSAHAQSLLDELHSDASPEQRLEGFLFAMFDRLQSNPDYLKLLQRNLVEGWEENQAFLVELALQPVVTELRELLNQYLPGKGEDITAIAIFSMIIGFLTMMPVISHVKKLPLQDGGGVLSTPIMVAAIMDYIRAAKR